MPYVKIFLVAPLDDDEVVAADAADAAAADAADAAAAAAAGMLGQTCVADGISMAATTAAAAPPPLDGRVWAATVACAATGACATAASADGAAELLLLSDFGAKTPSSPKDVPAALSSAAKMSL